MIRGMRECSYPECGRPLLSKGLCQTHYSQYRKGESLRPIKHQRKPKANKPCAFRGCIRHATQKGLCPAHRKQQLKGQELQPLRGEFRECTFAGCERRVNSKGLCMAHARQRMRGIELKPIHVPSYRYRHGGYVYLYEPAHPSASKNGMVAEHVKIMSDLIGRPLREKETVHHRNGIKNDNRPENLELWASIHPKGQRIEDLLEFAKKIIGAYG